MSKVELNEILSRNNVSQDDFLKETYNCMIVSIFEALVDEMSDSAFRKRVQDRLRASENQILSVKSIVRETIDCILNDAEASRVLDFLLAHFRKKNNRFQYDSSVRERKLVENNNRCNICGKPISLSNSELDHIIPWSLVGDELGESNLQMLCMDCNRRKSKNVTYNLKMFLINKTDDNLVYFPSLKCRRSLTKMSINLFTISGASVFEL